MKKIITWIWSDERKNWEFSRTALFASIAALILFLNIIKMIFIESSEILLKYSDYILDVFKWCMIFYLGKRVNENVSQIFNGKNKNKD